MSKRNRNKNRKRNKRISVRTRKHHCLIENEVNYTFKWIKPDDLSFADSGAKNRYREWTNQKWNSLSLSAKQAVAYHQRNQKLFVLEEKLVDFLLPKTVSLSEIDREKLKGLPKCFIIDLSDSNNMLTPINTEEERNTPVDMDKMSYPHSMNSIIVHFEDESGNLCNPEEYHNICVRSMFAHNPKYPRFTEDPHFSNLDFNPARDYDTARNRLFLIHDEFSLSDKIPFPHWQSDSAEFSYGSDFEITTVEENSLGELDVYCDQLGIQESARLSYSDAYLRSAYLWFVNKNTPNSSLDYAMRDLHSLIGSGWESNPQLLKSIRKLLLSPIIHDFSSDPKCLRRLLTVNIVTSFFKSLTEEHLIQTKKKSFSPILRTKSRREQTKHLAPIYSYITIDTAKLALLKKERKSAVRRSERYQTQVEGFSAFRWVGDNKLIPDEDIFDLRESKVGTILYKVKRPISGYTRNKHLPKRDKVSNSPRKKIVRVKSFR